MLGCHVCRSIGHNLCDISHNIKTSVSMEVAVKVITY